MAVRAYGDEILRRVGLPFLSICKWMQVMDFNDSRDTVNLCRVEPAYGARRASEFETLLPCRKASLGLLASLERGLACSFDYSLSSSSLSTTTLGEGSSIPSCA